MSELRPDPPLALVVDDNPSLRLLAAEALRGLGYRIVEATDGEEAIRTLEASAPDLVILDVRMPRVDGFEVCRRLRALPACRHVPVLMLTGLEDTGSINEAYEAGATDFLTKPVNWALFRHRVRYLMRAARTFADLRTNQTRLAEAQQIARLGYFAYEPAGDRVLCSDELREIFRLPQEGILDLEDFLAYTHPDDRAYVRHARLTTADHGAPYDIRYRMLAGDGAQHFVNEQARLSPAEGSAPARLVGAILDITERQRIEEQVAFLAYRDSLTGLPNRRLFEDRFQEALTRAGAESSPVACLFVDLDRFKQINDTFGHTVGDQLLQRVATRLRESLRPGPGQTGSRRGATIARFGGDEFIVLLEQAAGAEHASRVAQRIKDTMARPFTLAGSELLVTASIGIALCPEHGDTVDHLLKHADIAMYAAKEKGRNNFQFYADEMYVDASTSLSLQSRLHKALDREELVLHYQPIYDCRSGRLAKVEALVRWRHPDEGLIPPGRFISIAEETGLIHPIGEWVLETAARQWRVWHETEGLIAPRIAINLSARQFQQGNVTQLVGDALARYELPSASLELEITEGTLMENSEASIRLLDRLQEMGVGLAIDDFGTGYSSLAYLKRFPLQCLKIDRSFVTDLTLHDDDDRIVSAIIAMAHGLRLQVVAEGVERRSQLEFLRREGCDMAQGYLLARPLPAAQLAPWLAAPAPGASEASGASGASEAIGGSGSDGDGARITG